MHAMRGKEFIEYDNPFDVGMTGLLGFSSGYHAMMSCDVLLMLGTDFPVPAVPAEATRPSSRSISGGTARSARPARPRPRGRHQEAPFTPSCRKLEPAARTTGTSKTSLEHYQKARKDLDELAVGEPGRKPIHPQYVARVVDELAAEGRHLSCDVGTPTVWAARYLTMNGQRRLLGSFNHGSMANALPQAIGAQASHRGRQVISLSETAVSRCSWAICSRSDSSICRSSWSSSGTTRSPSSSWR